MTTADLSPENHLRINVSKKYRYIILGIILGLSFFYLMKSCSFMNHSEEYFRIGQDNRWRELNLMGKERNFSAFSHELLIAAAKEAHFHVNLITTSDPMGDLEQGNLEGILTTLQPNYLNENRLLFSEPYFLFGPVLIIPSSVPVEGWNEKRKKILAIPGNSPHLLNLEQDPSVQVKLYYDILHALADLSERRIDGAIFPAIEAHTYIITFYKNELKIASLPLTPDGVRLVALNNPKGQSLIKSFNEGFASLKENGIYPHLLERWGLVNIEHNVQLEKLISAKIGS